MLSQHTLPRSIRPQRPFISANINFVNPKTLTQNSAESCGTLCFGGSFNPIHVGHLRCAEAAAREAGFGRVLLIPNAQPPHKPADSELAPAADRLAMAKLAARSMRGSIQFDVDDMEVCRDGPSYTIDTVRALKENGWPAVSWLIGADMLNYLPYWHRIDELLNEVQFLVLQRPGSPIEWSALPLNIQPLRDKIVAAPLIDISATEIRRKVRAGDTIDRMTPRPVVEYIRAHRLYVK